MNSIKSFFVARWIQIIVVLFVVITNVVMIFVADMLSANTKLSLHILILTGLIIQFLDVLRVGFVDRQAAIARDRKRIKNCVDQHYFIFMTKYKRNKLLCLWDKLTGKICLAAYVVSGFNATSTLTYRVTLRQFFQLKLHGFIDSDNPQSVYKAEKLLGIEN